MTLGVFVAVLPYLGVPRVIDNWLFSAAGLSIFFLLVFSKKSKPIHLSPVKAEEKLEDVTVPIQDYGSFLSHEGYATEARSLSVSHNEPSAEHTIEIHPDGTKEHEHITHPEEHPEQKAGGHGKRKRKGDKTSPAIHGSS